MTTTVNGQLIRRGSTADMIRAVPRIVSELSRRLTLDPGTLILTGGPPRLRGQGDLSFLKPGDEVAVEISEIGKLVNRIVAA